MFKPEEIGPENSNEKFNAQQKSMTLNMWDGRLTRELQFVKAVFDFVSAQEGARGLAYYTIIMSGKNHAYGHYHAHDRVLADSPYKGAVPRQWRSALSNLGRWLPLHLHSHPPECMIPCV